MIKPRRRACRHRALVTRRDLLSMAIALAVVLLVALTWRESQREAAVVAAPAPQSLSSASSLL